MEAPIIAIESIELKPGFKKKHTFLVDMAQARYQEYVNAVSTDIINYMNENGGVYGNMDAGEYAIRYTPLKIEVVVK